MKNSVKSYLNYWAHSLRHFCCCHKTSANPFSTYLHVYNPWILSLVLFFLLPFSFLQIVYLRKAKGWIGWNIMVSLKKKNKTKCPNSYRMLVSRPITRKQGVSWGKVPPLRPENHYSPLLMMWIKFSVNCHSRALGLKSPLSSKHWQQACLFCQIISFNFNLMLILEVIRSTVTWWRLEIICQNVTL